MEYRKNQNSRWILNALEPGMGIKMKNQVRWGLLEEQMQQSQGYSKFRQSKDCGM